MATSVAAPDWYLSQGSLKIHPSLVNVVEKEVCPGTGFEPAYFWHCLERLIEELRPEVERCLQRREELRSHIDAFYSEHKGAGSMLETSWLQKCKEKLLEIGYLEEDRGPLSVSTEGVDPELAQLAAPQLVVPSDNARYVLNAVNSRWGSLFDALYGFDVISEGSAAGGYCPARGKAVIEYANTLLDEIAPLAASSWSQVTRLWPHSVGSTQQLVLRLSDGTSTALKTPSLFVGFTGSMGPASGDDAFTEACKFTADNSAADKGRIFLKHNGLHIVLEIDRDDRIGKASLSGIKDITMEAALSTILDMEDSVAAVDADDKVQIYSNICGVLRGTLESTFKKGSETMTRRARPDFSFRSARGPMVTLPGRAVCLVRNVGHHMFTDMVLHDGKTVPEGFVDCLMTVAAALPDVRGQNDLTNSRTGSVYIVKPKMHGPREVALTTSIFTRVEQFFRLRRDTIKMGIMDEERRTSVNLREAIREAASRVFFINTGFLDRTGDEISTCMLAGPVVRKVDMRKETWIKAYEASNVDVGLRCGLQGRAQIGKGMWAKPDSMKAMLDAKINELLAGASCAWVPSPTAAALHSIHYHRVEVEQRQLQLAVRVPASVDDILTPPLLSCKLTAEAIAEELKECAQSMLGYVVRWVDLGVGCSKVPDLQNVGLMEDRATLRISSQLLANWLRHGLLTEAQIRQTFGEMAAVVDGQNAQDRAYRPMAGNLDTNIAFQAALKLVLEGYNTNGYTEFTLHEARRKVKAAAAAAVASGQSAE